MTMITLKTLMSASFTSPAITMMQNTTNSKSAGGMISAHMFYTTIAATLSPMIVNYISIFFGAAQNPAIYGQIITFISFFGYLGSIPFWWLAGRSYK